MNRTALLSIAVLGSSCAAHAQFTYDFESLNLGDIVGQDGWTFVQNFPEPGSAVIQSLRVSPVGGSQKALKFSRTEAQAANPLRTIVRNVTSPISAGAHRVSYDVLMSSRTEPLSLLTGRLILFTPTGTNTNDQILQDYVQNNYGPFSRRFAFVDTDGLGPDAFASYQTTSGTMDSDRWYRVSMDLDFDRHTITNCRFQDISSGVVGLPDSMGALKNARGDHALTWTFHNDGSNWFQTLGKLAFRFSGFAGAAGVEYVVFDNLKITNLVPVTAHVDFLDFDSAPNHERVVVEFIRTSDGVVLDRQALQPDASGNLLAFTSLQGDFDVAVKGTHWLRSTHLSVTVTSTGGDAGRYALFNGDIDGDNSVSLADYSMFLVAFGSDGGDPGTTDPSTDWNRDADLNGDNEVSLGDYSVLVANFGQSGDE